MLLAKDTRKDYAIDTTDGQLKKNKNWLLQYVHHRKKNPNGGLCKRSHWWEKKKNPKWLLEYEHRRIISQNGLTRE